MRSSIPKSVFVTLGGGLGDVYCTYFRGENGWNYVKPLKTRFPHVIIKALCSTHNPGTLELIKYNPYIDHMQDFGWVLDGNKLWEKYRGHAIKIHKCEGIKKILKPEKPKLYLSKEDKDTINKIQDNGKFILIHPFAGEPHRYAMPAEEYVPLIDQLIDQKNYHVVLIGNTYNRKNLRHSEHKPEELPYFRNGLTNLINYTNSRIAKRLSELQTYFIGTWSAFSCASWVSHNKTIVVTQKSEEDKLKRKLSPNGRWKNSVCTIVTTQGPASDPKGTNFKAIRKHIIDLV